VRVVFLDDSEQADLASGRGYPSPDGKTRAVRRCSQRPRSWGS